MLYNRNFADLVTKLVTPQKIAAFSKFCGDAWCEGGVKSKF